MVADARALFASPILDTYVLMVVIDHPTITQPIYLTTHTADLTAKGIEWYACQLLCKLPTRSNNLRTAEITVQNVDSRIGKAAQAINTPATIYISCTKAEALPGVGEDFEIEYPPMRLANITGGSISITGELVPMISREEPYPKGRTTKSVTPGLYSDVLAVY